MILRMFLMLIVVGAIIGGIFGFKFWTFAQMGAQMAAMKMPPSTVTAVDATKEAWQPVVSSIGSVQAVQGVEVSAEIAGRVTEIFFESGSVVKKGTPLVKLDTATEEANLKRAEARAVLARSNLERAAELRRKQATAVSDHDAAVAEADQATAEVDVIKVSIEKKTIRAPFDGQLGIRKINLGQQLETGDSIVWIQSVDPIYVNFSVPQQKLPSIGKAEKVKVTTDAYPGLEIEGKLTAINAAIDSATRNVQVQATLDNKEQKLKPGMFVNVAVILPVVEQLITIPVTSVTYNPYGNTVYILEQMKDEKTGESFLGARPQVVTLGERRGDQVAVLTGIKEGEKVATSGLMKLRPRSPVVVDNTITPANDPSPKPADT